MHTTTQVDRARAVITALADALSRLTRRARLSCEAGQGTVEYVALVLLVGGILAAAVAASGGFRAGPLRDAVGNKITEAINTVGAKGAK